MLSAPPPWPCASKLRAAPNLWLLNKKLWQHPLLSLLHALLSPVRYSYSTAWDGSSLWPVLPLRQLFLSCLKTVTSFPAVSCTCHLKSLSGPLLPQVRPQPPLPKLECLPFSKPSVPGFYLLTASPPLSSSSALGTGLFSCLVNTLTWLSNLTLHWLSLCLQ